MMRILAILLVFVSIPLFVTWMKDARARPWMYFAVGLLPFTINAWNLDAAIVNWAMWPGHTKGLVITLLDSLCLAILIAQSGTRRMPPVAGFLIAYIVAAALSIAQAEVMPAAAFYVFQLLRTFLVFLAISKIVRDEAALKWLAMGLAAGISYQAGVCIMQKSEGAFQTSGTMGHQNLLGLMTHFVTFPLMAMLLGGVRSRVMMVGVVASFVVLGLGASRGAVGFSLIGLGLLVALSLIRRPTGHKWRMTGFAVLALAATSPLIIEGMAKRFQQMEMYEGSYDERAAFEKAAKMMWSDHPMGVGANEYVVVANTSEYSRRAGVIWNTGSRSAHVHNTYLLVAAETGWLGLLSFAALFIAIIANGLRFAFQDRRDPRGDIVLGATVAMIVTAGHNLYEWIWVTYQAQYVFAISAGIIAGLVQTRASEARQRRRAARREARARAEANAPTGEPAPAGGQP